MARPPPLNEEALVKLGSEKLARLVIDRRSATPRSGSASPPLSPGPKGQPRSLRLSTNALQGSIAPKPSSHHHCELCLSRHSLRVITV